MKNVVITVTILIAAATITATYPLWTPPYVTCNFIESFGSATTRSGGPLMLKNTATTFPGCPTDMNSSRQIRQAIVTASALFSDSEDGDEKEVEGDGKDEEKEGDDKDEDQGVDRLWNACKCG